MKRLILILAVLLTTTYAYTAAADPSAAGDNIVPYSGILAGAETLRFERGKIVLEGTASGSSSMGNFTYSYYQEFDQDRLAGVVSGQLTFADGATVALEGLAVAEASSLTEVLHFISGSGRFTGAIGTLIVQRTQNSVAANAAGQIDISGAFKGYYTAGPQGNGQAAAAVRADRDDSVVLVCDNGRERNVSGGRLTQYLERHPGSYVGRCQDPTNVSR